MRNIAIGILVIVIASILLQPLLELSNVFREKLAVNTALSNAYRAAKDRSLNVEELGNLNALTDETRFKDYFAEAFEDAMNLTLDNKSGDTLTFKSNSSQYNGFKVTVDFENKLDSPTGQQVTIIELEAVSEYKFKTKYLKLAEDSNPDVGFQIIGKREFTVSVKN